MLQGERAAHQACCLTRQQRRGLLSSDVACTGEVCMATWKCCTARFAKLLAGAAFRVKTGGWNNLLSYTFTRFWTVRRSLRWVRSHCPRPALPAASATLFRELDVAALKIQLEQQGFFNGLSLPE